MIAGACPAFETPFLLLILTSSCGDPDSDPPKDAATIADAGPGDAESGDADTGEPEPYCRTTAVRWQLGATNTPSIPIAEDRALTDVYAAAIDAEATAIATALSSTECGGRAGIEHLRALVALGDSERCLAFAMSCLEGHDVLDDQLSTIAHYGARCAGSRGKEALAFELLDRATDPLVEDQCNERSGRVFWHAVFAVDRGHEDRLDAIFMRAPSIDEEAARKAIGFWAGTGGTLEDLRAFIESSFTGSDPLLSETLALIWLGLLARNARYLEARAFIIDNESSLARSGLILGTVPNLYTSLYATSNGADFSIVDRIYQPYALAAAPTSWFPYEHNVHSYAEMYQDVCVEGLLSGQALQRYRQQVTAWKAGSITDANALRDAEELLAESGDKAELLTFIGALLERSGDDRAAIDRYFRAHRACTYYNRSHWAMRGALLWGEIQGRDDYQANLAERDQVLSAIGEVSSLPAYASNYASLAPEQVDHLKYAIRFWVPYLDRLSAAGQSIYVKHTFELLSEVPGLEGVRDTRIDYPEDYRLWDDVRGAGGNPVAVDATEMRLNPFGEYNLAAHEIAHQVELIVPPAFTQCKIALYQAASARGVFVNYYAALNESEYFAEGVVTYMIAPGAPPYFGTNQQWLVDNDPELFDFVAQLSAGTPFDAVLCPL